MNYTKNFAEMFGVELYEELTLYDMEKNIEYLRLFRITEKGVESKLGNQNWKAHEFKLNELNDLLMGRFVFHKISFTPKLNERYYTFNPQKDWEVYERKFSGSLFDILGAKMGMFFKREKDAEYMRPFVKLSFLRENFTE